MRGRDRDLAGAHEADTSTVGIALAIASLIAMPVLAVAKRRTGRQLGSVTGLESGNVELVEADISTYQPPPDTNAVVSTFVIEIRPDYRDITQRLTTTLADNGRIATTGLRHPDRWPEWLIALGTGLVS